MPIDGGIDYSKYTREQLADALDRIDRSRFPTNHAALLKELTARTPDNSRTVSTAEPVPCVIDAMPKVRAPASSVSVVLKYTATQWLATALVGFVAGVVDVPWERAAVWVLVFCSLAAFVVYFHMAQRHPVRYWPGALMVTVLSTLVNLVLIKLLHVPTPTAVTLMDLLNSLLWFLGVAAVAGVVNGRRVGWGHSRANSAEQ
jgi:hypothetical protein